MENRLREIRGDIKQEELAELTGIERSKLSRIETGQRKMTATEALYLSEALGVRPSDFFEGTARRVERYRGNVPEEARATAAAFRHLVDDMLFVDRTVGRHGLD